MAYKNSVPAAYAAQVLLNTYTLHERTKVEATKANVATLIDLYTQIFRIEKALRDLFASVRWAASDLPQQIEGAQALLRELQKLYGRLPKFEERVEIGSTSAAAYAAADALVEHFVFTPKKTLPATLNNIANIVEFGCNVFRLDMVMPEVDALVNMTTADATRDIHSMRKTLRALEEIKNRLPSQDTSPVPAPPRAAAPPPRITQERRREIALVSEALRRAHTPREQLEVMQKAGMAQ